MVGVPGKSKGCTTCRRRKIRCDLGIPSCKKCTQSGRTCEGYAHYPVFLNRTAEGLEKRHGLEEAKGLSSSTHSRLETNSTEAEVNSSRGLPDNRTANDNRLLAQPGSSTVFDQQIISSFWEKYIPNNAYAQGGPSSHWLQLIINLPKPGQATYYSLKALAMTRLGWIYGDDTLVLQGRKFYARGLQVLQKSLLSENIRYDDGVFAAGYILSVYELFESTAPSIAGWNSHISGLGNLVLQRGPARHQTPWALSVLEEFRYSTMIQCIQFRRSSFLGNRDWLTIPWGESDKDVYQQLYDKGFALAALLEKMDNANLTNPETHITQLSRYLHRCSEMHSDFEAWYQELLQESPSPLYWTTESDISSDNVNVDRSNEALKPRTSPPFSFPSLRHAYITGTFWALKLILSNTIALTCGGIMSIISHIQPGPSNAGSKSDLRNIAQSLLAQHGSPQRLELATKIMRSMPYSLNDSMGLLGAAKSLFPLRVALFSLRRQPGQELKWCQAVYQELETRKGLRYAREIAKLDGKYIAAGLAAPHGSETSGEGREERLLRCMGERAR